MIDLDTSVMVALLTPEEHSSTALEWLAQCCDSLVSCDWLTTETYSVLAIKQRHDGLTRVPRQAPWSPLCQLPWGRAE